MEPNRFFFKLTAILLQYILLILVFLPLIYLTQLIKYNFHSEEIYFLKVLFLAVAIAMPFAVANAFAFANFEQMEAIYYLKAKQRHKVLINNPAGNIRHNLLDHLGAHPFWKLRSEKPEDLEYSVRSILISDRVSIHLHPVGEEKTEVIFESRPRLGFLFLDFGRNYRNILKALLATNP